MMAVCMSMAKHMVSTVHPAATVEQVYRDHARFVWATLHRMGVAESDLADGVHEVFIVVHRRFGSYDGESQVTSWLYGICRRKAAAYRRRAFRRREKLGDSEAVPTAVTTRTPEDDAARADARRELAGLLDALPTNKRVVFVMFELEDLSCEDISQRLSIPLGTVYSRLHSARRDFEQRVSRLRKSRTRGGPR